MPNKKDLFEDKNKDDEDSEEDDSMYKSIHLIKKIEVDDEDIAEGNLTDSDDDWPVNFTMNKD